MQPIYSIKVVIGSSVVRNNMLQYFATNLISDRNGYKTTEFILSALQFPFHPTFLKTQTIESALVFNTDHSFSMFAKFFRTNTSYPLIRRPTCAYHGDEKC